MIPNFTPIPNAVHICRIIMFEKISTYNMVRYVENLLNDFLVLLLLVTNSVAPVTTGMTKKFTFHIRWISTCKYLCFNISALPFMWHSEGIGTSINKHIFNYCFVASCNFVFPANPLFLVSITMCGIFSRASISACAPSFRNILIYSPHIWI
jgi:hypothetical protein